MSTWKRSLTQSPLVFILRILTGWQETSHQFAVIFSLYPFHSSSQTHHSILGIDTFPFVLQLCCFPLLLDTFSSSWRNRIFLFPLYTVCRTDSSYPNYSSHDFCQLVEGKKKAVFEKSILLHTQKRKVSRASGSMLVWKPLLQLVSDAPPTASQRQRGLQSLNSVHEYTSVLFLI